MTVTAARVILLALLPTFVALPAAAIAGEIETISPQQLADLQAPPDHPLLVIDLRPEADFMAGTVAGALHGEPDPGDFAPPGDVREAVLIPPADDTGGYAAAWAARLRQIGIRVMLLRGGPEEWHNAGVRMQRPGPSYADPGKVPFVIPRGICEHLPPVQEY